MNIPENLRYAEDHEWVRVDDDGRTAWIGISDFAQSELGEIVYVEVDTVGETLDKGDVFGTVEAVKTTSDLIMPISGKVLEFNPELDENQGDNPTLLNEDPYGKGWIIKVEITDPTELEALMTAKAYAKMIG